MSLISGFPRTQQFTTGQSNNVISLTNTSTNTNTRPHSDEELQHLHDAALKEFFQVYQNQLTSIKSLVRIGRAYLGDKSRINELPVVLQVLELWCNALLTHLESTDGIESPAAADGSSNSSTSSTSSTSNDSNKNFQDNSSSSATSPSLPPTANLDKQQENPYPLSSPIDSDFETYLTKRVLSLPLNNVQYVTIEGLLVAGCIAYVRFFSYYYSSFLSKRLTK